MPSITFELTLEFDEPVVQSDIHSSLQRVIEDARRNSQLSPDDVACTDIELHFVGDAP